MTKRRAGIDFDDVVAHFNRAFSEAHNEWYGTEVTYQSITTYDLGVIYGATHHEMLERVRRFCHERHDDIVPVEGAREGLAALAENYELHLITSRCHTLRDITTEWLQAYDLFAFSELHFTNGFGFTSAPKRTKLQVCQSIEAAFLIDDAPEHAQAVAAGGIPVILLDTPWNQGVGKEKNLQRAYTWAEAVNHLKALP